MGEESNSIVFPNGKFGDYDVLRFLGQGGMGAVYLMRDPDGNELAAKILFPEEGASGSDGVKRFVREAELAMSVVHPNLMHVYDVGRDPETRYGYIIMDYAPGGSLSERIDREGALPLGAAISCVRQLARALRAIEARHVVHRDIKPDNILFDASGHPVLTDLGIAKKASRRDARAHGTGNSVSNGTLTLKGEVVGTPAYMAPEQALDSRRADIRSDIYSLGVVFFQMLTGKLPHEGRSTMEQLARAMKGIPLPDVREFNPALPAGVAEVVRQMTHPKRLQRVGTAVQLVQLLERLDARGNLLPDARKVRRLVESRRRQNAFPVAEAVVALLVAALALAVAFNRTRLFGGRRARPAPAAASAAARPGIEMRALSGTEDDDERGGAAAAAPREQVDEISRKYRRGETKADNGKGLTK